MSKKTQTDIQRINQALSAAISSINLAKNLLKDIEGSSESRIDTREIEGIVGIFDGKSLVTIDGVRLDVPVNYASKSKIVFGDTLKMIEDNDRKVFKQIERVKRLTKIGILSKQGDEMVVVTGDGTYKILQVAVEFYNLKDGGQVQVLVPEDNIHAPFATIDKNLENMEDEHIKKTDKLVIKKEVEVKQIEAKKIVEHAPIKKEVVTQKYTSKKIVPDTKLPPKVIEKVSTKKPEVNTISDIKKPKTSKLINDDNSISRIIGDDDLR